MAVKIRSALETLVTVKVSHSAATTVDNIYLLNGSRVGLAMNTALINALNIFVIGGIVEYKAETGVAWTAGDALYWDDTNKQFTKTSSGNTKCAIAYEDKAAATALGCVLLIPTP
jgi:predicted RecA/RadA family phage recombinase